MNFLLKIVEGPNKGAEIALVESVAVTLGKSDECDIVLADPILPAAPLSIEASSDAVSVDGEPLEPFAVKTLGATSFAVGPADAPWGELRWPEKAEAREKKAEGSEMADGGRKEEGASRAASPAPSEVGKDVRKRGGCLGCLVVVILLSLALGGLGWHYRHLRKPAMDAAADFYNARLSHYVAKAVNLFERKIGGRVDPVKTPSPVTLEQIAWRYGLALVERDGQAKLSGNLKTRSERLRATAEAYEIRPGVDLDLSDDESFKAAADDALFTITEGAMKVLFATNRVLAIVGRASSPHSLKRVLEALDADLPKLRCVNAAGVAFGHVPKRETSTGAHEGVPAGTPRVLQRAAKTATSLTLPVCGILTKPYPCLVMRDGSRVLEGATIGGSVIVKIDADAVTVTNATGRFTWRP